MSKIKYFILQHIFPGFYATYANKIIAKNYDKLEIPHNVTTDFRLNVTT